MLKWAVPNQRRSATTATTDSTITITTADTNQETCSNASSDSSENSYDLSVPIRYHERRASRPKSLAIPSQDTEFDRLDSVKKPITHRTASSPMYASCSRANRHSMYITPSHDDMDRKQKSLTIDSMHARRLTPSKLSVYQPSDNSDNTQGSTTSDVEGDSGILRITTSHGIDKTKSSRSSFWKSLRQKAQGKSKEKKLAKANSMSNLPVSRKVTPTEVHTEPSKPTETKATIPVPIPIANDISPNYKSKSNVLRRRSLKVIKKENENKKPKPFSTKPTELPNDIMSSSPDSGVSSMRLNSNDSDNPGSPDSPITPIDLEPTEPTDLSCLKQQFTDAVLQYLNERLEKKGYRSTISVSSARSSKSEEGASDVFCYDTDTVLRRPHNNNNNNSRTSIKASF